MLELSEIKVEVDRLAHRIGASGCVLPTYGSTDDGAKPHIETDVRGYHYVVVERGKELRRITTRDLGELLFHIFEAVTFSLACDYELSHHVESQDRRRMIFRRQSELLAVLSREWSDRASDSTNRFYASTLMTTWQTRELTWQTKLAGRRHVRSIHCRRILL